MATLSVAVAADVGHLVIDAENHVVQADEGATQILRAAREELTGRLIIDLVESEDRPTFAGCLQHLRREQRPFRVAMRLRCPKGNHVWVEATVALSTIGEDGQQVVITLVPIGEPDRFYEPAKLLNMARLLRMARDDQRTLFGDDLFVAPAWDITIACYVAEAEGRTLDLSNILMEAGVNASVALRWIRVLADRNILEAEGGGSHFRLTHNAHQLFERLLVHRIVKFSVEPM